MADWSCSSWNCPREQPKLIVLCSSAKPRRRSHAALLGGQEGVSAHRGTCCRVRTVQDGGKHGRVDPVLLRCPRTSGRKGKIYSRTGMSGRDGAKLNSPLLGFVWPNFVVLPPAAHHWSGNSAHWKPAIPKESRGCFLSSGSPERLPSGHAGRNAGGCPLVFTGPLPVQPAAYPFLFAYV